MKRIPIMLALLFLMFGAAYAQQGYVQEGQASYYADKFHGRTTASGERYDMNKHTCAHMSLPFGTVLRVTNLENQQSTLVRVNDRGPFSPNRIVDLSRAAAQEVDMITKGVVKVKIETVPSSEFKESEPSPADRIVNQVNTVFAPPATVETPAPSAPPANVPAAPTTPKPTAADRTSDFFSIQVNYTQFKGYGVQIASYKELTNLMKRVADLPGDVKQNLKVQVVENQGSYSYKLIVGPYTSKIQAESMRTHLQASFPGCFLVSL